MAYRLLLSDVSSPVKLFSQKNFGPTKHSLLYNTQNLSLKEKFIISRLRIFKSRLEKEWL